MTGRALHREDPDRLYTVTRGRSRPKGDVFDVVTLVVSAREPSAGMQSEHARILRMCARPTAVVEISARLRLPVSVVKILLHDLLDDGSITIRQPTVAPTDLPDAQTLEQVLVALRKL